MNARITAKRGYQGIGLLHGNFVALVFTEPDDTSYFFAESHPTGAQNL